MKIIAFKEVEPLEKLFQDTFACQENVVATRDK